MEENTTSTFSLKRQECLVGGERQVMAELSQVKSKISDGYSKEKILNEETENMTNQSQMNRDEDQIPGSVQTVIVSLSPNKILSYISYSFNYFRKSAKLIHWLSLL